MKTKLLRLWLTVLMLFVTSASYAYEAYIDGIYYNFVGNSAIVTYLNSQYSNNKTAYTGDVVIPNSVDYYGKTYSVTTIGINAFQGCSSLTSVNIPESVTTIEKYAFQGCSSLTSINIPESITIIRTSTFNECSSLTSINIPKSVTTIELAAFLRCSSLTSINIPESVTTIENSAFGDCVALTRVNITNLKAWCQIRFGDMASNPLYCAHHLFLNDEEVKDLVIPESISAIGRYAFSACSSLTSVNIPASVTTIETYAFWGCSSLASINIPESVTTIENTAFRDCMALTRVSLPKSVTTIEGYVFKNCSSLASIIIPNSVTSIGEQAFCDCTGLHDIYNLNPTPPTCDENVFRGLSPTTINLHVPKGAAQAYATAPQWQDFTNIVEDAQEPEPETPENPSTSCDCAQLQATVVSQQATIDKQQTAIQALIQIITNHTCGDMNGDNKVTISDINQVIEKVLNQQ